MCGLCACRQKCYDARVARKGPEETAMNQTSPIRSMTAFARRETHGDWGNLSCELRSVNHRYLEPALRLPESLRELENHIRGRLRESLGRGKVDVQLRLELIEAGAQQLDLDMDAVRRLSEGVDRVRAELSEPAPVSPLELMGWPGVVASGEPPLEQVRETAVELFEQTLADLIDTRRREGERLAPLFGQRLSEIEAHVAGLRERMPEWLAQQHQALRDRVAELQAGVDEERLAQELAMMAQKADVSEELDRLDAHVAEVRDALGRTEPVGRRLDFLMQELNREANTLSSKSVAAELTRVAVELKVLIEQMREQVQNVE